MKKVNNHLYLDKKAKINSLKLSLLKPNNYSKLLLQVVAIKGITSKPRKNKNLKITLLDRTADLKTVLLKTLEFSQVSAVEDAKEEKVTDHFAKIFQTTSKKKNK